MASVALDLTACGLSCTMWSAMGVCGQEHVARCWLARTACAPMGPPTSKLSDAVHLTGSVARCALLVANSPWPRAVWPELRLLRHAPHLAGSRDINGFPQLLLCELVRALHALRLEKTSLFRQKDLGPRGRVRRLLGLQDDARKREREREREMGGLVWLL